MDSKTNLNNIESLTIKVIRQHWGGNEITGKTLAHTIGLKQRDSGKEGADIRSIINSIRRKGIPVCANGKGYYYPRNLEEIHKYKKSLEGRLRKAREALEGIELSLGTWERNPSLQGIDEQNILEI